MFEAMHEIEALCARLVAQRLTLLAKSQLEAAQARCHEAAKAGDFQAYLRANEALHFAIYQATGNPYIQQMASDFRRRTGPFRAKKFATKADLIASAHSHDELLEKSSPPIPTMPSTICASIWKRASCACSPPTDHIKTAILIAWHAFL